MKIRLLGVALFLGVQTTMFAQSVPRSSHASDQVIQGPCFIFAATAALESRALQNPNNGLSAGSTNFNEWQSYSTCAIGGRIWGGLNLIEATFNQAGDHGMSSGTHANPTILNCPNPNDPQVPCIADFSCVSTNNTWCETNTMYSPNNFGSLCNDVDGTGRTFNIIPGSDYDYILRPDANGDYFRRENNITHSAIGSLLSNGHGVIAFVDNWNGTGVRHAIFIYQKIGQTYKYKDSWPGAATANGASNLDLSKVVRLFYVTGTVEPKNGIIVDPNPDPDPNPTPTPCDYSLQGSNTISANGTTTYTLSGGTGTVSNIVWNYPNSASLVSGLGTTTLTLYSANCTSSTGTVSVSYVNNGSACSDAKNVTVQGGPTAKPTGIEVWGFDWYHSGVGMGQTCPNVRLELHPIDPNNPSYPVTTYQWSVMGGTILSGQGTDNLAVRTGNASQVTFAVRANKNNCGYSGWKYLSATSPANFCSNIGIGDGGLGGPSLGMLRQANMTPTELDFTPYFLASGQEEVQVEIISMTGQQLLTETANLADPIQHLSRLPSGWVFIRLYQPSNGEHITLRHRIGE